MELFFCDLCQEAVPQADIDLGVASVQGTRIVCARCNLAMGLPVKAVDSQPEADSGLARNRGQSELPARRSRPLISSGLGAVLGLGAIMLTLVAVVALLFRIELVSRHVRKLHDSNEERISDLEERTAGTRDRMVARARRAAEDTIYAELERLQTVERQLTELRQLLALGDEAAPGKEPSDSGTGVPIVLSGSSLLTAGDAMARVDELEEQQLFLQARVFELLEEGPVQVAKGEPQPRLLLPPGEVGELIAQLAHPDPIERVGALYALALTEDTGVVRHIVPLLKDPDAYIRTLAARILERRDARSAVQTLISALGDTDIGVREAAVSALRAITEQQFRFDPHGRSSDRFAAAKRWEDWWEDSWRVFLYNEE
jgi:hypothetical protein